MQSLSSLLDASHLTFQFADTLKGFFLFRKSCESSFLFTQTSMRLNTTATMVVGDERRRPACNSIHHSSQDESTYRMNSNGGHSHTAHPAHFGCLGWITISLARKPNKNYTTCSSRLFGSCWSFLRTNSAYQP